MPPTDLTLAIRTLTIPALAIPSLAIPALAIPSLAIPALAILTFTILAFTTGALFAPLTAWSDTTGAGQQAPTQDRQAAQSQYDAGEFEAAAQAAMEVVSKIEHQGRPFDPTIVYQYRILGDAQLAAGSTLKALSVFERARQELRMLDGLHVQAQLQLLYREADAYHKLNDIKSANSRHEYAFDLQRSRLRKAFFMPALVALRSKKLDMGTQPLGDELAGILEAIGFLLTHRAKCL